MSVVRSHVLGFPSEGAGGELAAALAQFGRGELDRAALEARGRTLRERHWALQFGSGLDVVTVGDFAFHDRVAEHAQMFGAVPVSGHGEGGASGVASGFETAHRDHVPVFSPDTTFSLVSGRLLDEIAEARAAGHPVKPVLLGPVSFLWLGRSTVESFDRSSLLDRLLPVYLDLLARIGSTGVQWVQIDEPVLSRDLPPAWVDALHRAYDALRASRRFLLLATHVAPLGQHLALAAGLPVAGLHANLVDAHADAAGLLQAWPPDRHLSIGIVDGRSPWRTDLDRALAVLRKALAGRERRLWIAPSCSLQHVPFSLAGLSADPRHSGALEKLEELHLLKCGLIEGDGAIAHELAEWRRCRRG